MVSLEDRARDVTVERVVTADSTDSTSKRDVSFQKFILGTAK